MTQGRPDGQLILFCKCVYYDVISPAVREQVLKGISRGAADVEVVDDLCGLAAHRDPRLHAWAQGSSLAIVACFPRAVRCLFHAAGVPLPEQTKIFNMRTQSPEEITRELMMHDGSSMIEGQSGPSAPSHQSTINNQQSDWVPWFPVIDYDRCVNCKQCLNFCLFGVYGLSAEGKVEVQKPSGCKTNCPACARVCPRQAIVFPKYPDSPINGDEVAAGPSAPAESGPSQGAAATGDIYKRLRSRSAGGKRFPTQDEPSNRSCPTLDSLKRELNIPDDVLTSLSPAEMQRVIAKSKGQAEPQSQEKGNEKHE